MFPLQKTKSFLVKALRLASVSGYFTGSVLKMSAPMPSRSFPLSVVGSSVLSSRVKSVADKFHADVIFSCDDSASLSQLISIERDGLKLDEIHLNLADDVFEAELEKKLVALLSLSSKVSLGQEPLRNLWKLPVSDFKEELSVATYAVQLASVVGRELQKELLTRTAIEKNDKSPVTIADFSVQAIVLGIVHRCFPNDGFIAEENSSVLKSDPSSLAAVSSVVRKVFGDHFSTEDICEWIDLGSKGGKYGDSERTWVLDPIDGTKGFIRGEQFCCALGMLSGRTGALGVLGCPVLPMDLENPMESKKGQIAFAVKGCGAYRRIIGSLTDDLEKISTVDISNASDGIVLESAESAHTSHGVAFEVCQELQISRSPIRMDSQCKYACLAIGEGSIYLRMPRWGYRENIWDHLAGAVVIEEAGGKVTDSMGKELDFSRGTKLLPHVAGIVASSGVIHDQVIRAVRRQLGRDWVAACCTAKSADWKGAGPWPSSVEPIAPGTAQTPTSATDIWVVFRFGSDQRTVDMTNDCLAFAESLKGRFSVSAFWGESLDGIEEVEIYLGGRVIRRFNWIDSERRDALTEAKLIIEE